VLSCPTEIAGAADTAAGGKRKTSSAGEEPVIPAKETIISVFSRFAIHRYKGGCEVFPESIR
jgi:hypothetical protein